MSENVRLFPTPLLSWRHLAAAAAWITVVLAFAFSANQYYTGLGASIGILAILGLSMVLVTGYAGQFSLAVGAFYGIGAYASTLLTIKYGWIGLAAIGVGVLVAASVGFLLARPLFRLRGHFLAMATLALTEVFYLLVNNASYTGGSTGMGPVDSLSIFGYSFSTSQSHVILNWSVVGVVLWGALMLRNGRAGRALLAIRGNEAAAAAAGIDIAAAKARVFTASAVFSAVAGSLYAHELRYVNPPPFGLEGTFDVLMIAVLGGMRSPWGAVIGAVAYESLNQLIEGVLPSIVGTAGVGAGKQLIIGVLLVVILLVRPDGIAGAASAGWAWVKRRVRGPLKATEPTGTEPPTPGSTSDMRALRELADAEGIHAIGDEVLRAEHLSKRFGGVTAVDDVGLTLHAGEVLAVIGPNGAGKSTLVNLLSGNLVPDTGEVWVGGTEVTGLRAHRVAQHGLSRTFQTPCLFEGMDVEATVKVGAHLRGSVGLMRSAVPTLGTIKEEHLLADATREVLAQLGLDALADRDAMTLSLGQQKQIEIARALVARPRVILFDEPCAGLNKAEKASLMQALRALVREGIAVLVIEHDMEFVMSVADRVQVINFGATLRVGSPAEVQADQAVIDAYLGVSHETNTSEAPDETGDRAEKENVQR